MDVDASRPTNRSHSKWYVHMMFFEGVRFDEICCGHGVDGKISCTRWDMQNVGNKRIFTKSIGARTFSSTVLQLQYFTLLFARTFKFLLPDGWRYFFIKHRHPATLMTVFMATLSISIPSSIMPLRWWKEPREKQLQHPPPTIIEDSKRWHCDGKTQIFKTSNHQLLEVLRHNVPLARCLIKLVDCSHPIVARSQLAMQELKPKNSGICHGKSGCSNARCPFSNSFIWTSAKFHYFHSWFWDPLLKIMVTPHVEAYLLPRLHVKQRPLQTGKSIATINMLKSGIQQCTATRFAWFASSRFFSTVMLTQASTKSLVVQTTFYQIFCSWHPAFQPKKLIKLGCSLLAAAFANNNKEAGQ